MENITISPAMPLAGANRYPLELLDLLVMTTLNPIKNDLTQVDDELSATIVSELEAEEVRLQLLINSQIFALGNKNEIELLVRLMLLKNVTRKSLSASLKRSSEKLGNIENLKVAVSKAKTTLRKQNKISQRKGFIGFLQSFVAFVVKNLPQKKNKSK